MTASGGPGLRQPAHIVGQSLDIVRSVLHVVADVVGIRLGVFNALLKTT